MKGLELGRVLGEWGPFGEEENQCAVFTVGNPCEGHGPALPRDIDDRVVKALAARAADRTGSCYCAHVPYTSDRVGEIARAWSPLWIPQEEMVEKTCSFISAHLGTHPIRFRRIVLLNGHGGNNFMSVHEGAMSERIGLPFTFLIPFLGVEAGHADTPEHSVAAYLGLVDRTKLNEVNAVAKSDPREALRRWPPLGGLGGYILYGGDRFAELRKPEYGLVQCLSRFLEDRQIIADHAQGGEMFETMLSAACRGMA